MIFYVYNHVICKQSQYFFISNLESFSFSSLIAMVRTLEVLNKSGKTGHPCLVPDLR